MDTNFEEKKNNIVKKLNEVVPNLKCSACGTDNFELTGGYFVHDLQQDLIQRHIGGPSIPTVPIICTNCGYIMEFAAGKLGLLPPSNLENLQANEVTKDD